MSKKANMFVTMLIAPLVLALNVQAGEMETPLERYKEYRKAAVAMTSLEELRPYVSAAVMANVLKRYEAADTQMRHVVMGALKSDPKNMELKSETIENDTARILFHVPHGNYLAEGVPPQSGELEVTMKLESGQWVYYSGKLRLNDK